MLRLVSIILAIISIWGCSATPSKINHRPKTAENSIVNLNTDKVVKLLYKQFNHWKGTKYHFGGLSKKGIDCSGFVYITFKSQFGINLPRSTKLLSKIGLEIPKSKLSPGDLVFFKTKKLTRHVGIYVEHGKFLHVSTKKGVIISQLNNTYWKSKFWMARRIKI
ncbi:MAG: NlpC/P60 family protein [Candidatus Nitrosoglobus sp.]